jgi:hypothetical protein
MVKPCKPAFGSGIVTLTELPFLSVYGRNIDNAAPVIINHAINDLLCDIK